MLQKLDSPQKDFNNEYYAFQEAYSNAIVIDMSHWGLLKITGEDRLKFLHNLSTNNIKDLKPKQLCETIFINSIGRTLDLATAYIMENEIGGLQVRQERELIQNQIKIWGTFDALSSQLLLESEKNGDEAKDGTRKMKRAQIGRAHV